MLLEWLLKRKSRNDANPGMDGVQTGDKYYHCLSCDYVWPAPCPSPCKKCRSTNVTQCSEIVYINYVKESLQDKINVKKVRLYTEAEYEGIWI